MPVIRHADGRRTETPNAVMTTLASPTQGGADQAVWRVDMGPGQAGPRHTVDAGQVWTVLDGGATVEAADGVHVVAPGDTVVIPADTARRVTAHPVSGLAALVVASSPLHARALGDDQAGPACAATPGEPVVPAWVV